MTSRLADGRYIILSDLQSPYEDKKAVTAITDMIRLVKPDGLLCVGDEADSPEPSRWSRGSAAEYAGTLEAGLQRTYDVIKGFSDALGDKPFHIMRSNHCDRINNYLTKYAPAMSLTSWNDYTRIMGYGQTPLLDGRTEPIPVTWHTQPWEFAKGWVLAHGDEGPANATSGGTAMGLARKWGKSVVCGHTHKMGLRHEHRSLNGKITQELYGVEVGHLMNMGVANYLKAGSANWQQGFALLYVKQGHASVTPVPISRKGFIFEGSRWSW